ncbi:hypothetical protein ACP4OV_016050 [Aristida adscensionis]
MFSFQFLQKIVAETVGTYYLLMFPGCAAMVTNHRTGGAVTSLGVGIAWGLAVTVMVYSVGHISGAHLNPAVSIAFATCGRFTWKQVPAYMAAQVTGSTLAILTLRLLLGSVQEPFLGTVPSGSELQSLVLELIISFYLMFVISGVATDSRAIGELAGLAVGATVVIIVLFAGPISGASMNPARTIGPVIVAGHYTAIWVYIAGPICGMVAGAWTYNVIRFPGKPLREITMTSSFLRSARRNQSNSGNKSFRDLDVI